MAYRETGAMGRPGQSSGRQSAPMTDRELRPWLSRSLCGAARAVPHRLFAGGQSRPAIRSGSVGGQPDGMRSRRRALARAAWRGATWAAAVLFLSGCGSADGRNHQGCVITFTFPAQGSPPQAAPVVTRQGCTEPGGRSGPAHAPADSRGAGRRTPQAQLARMNA